MNKQLSFHYDSRSKKLTALNPNGTSSSWCLDMSEIPRLIDEDGVDALKSFLAAIRHLRPGACEPDAELQVSPDNSKDLDEAVELFKAGWEHMPPKLQAVITKVLRDSIEEGEAFIKYAREYELTEGVDNG